MSGGRTVVRISVGHRTASCRLAYVSIGAETSTFESGPCCSRRYCGPDGRPCDRLGKTTSRRSRSSIRAPGASFVQYARITCGTWTLKPVAHGRLRDAVTTRRLDYPASTTAFRISIRFAAVYFRRFHRFRRSSAFAAIFVLVGTSAHPQVIRGFRPRSPWKMLGNST